jgi:hypothetical protein
MFVRCVVVGVCPLLIAVRADVSGLDS